MKIKKQNLSRLLRFLILRMKLNKDVNVYINKKFLKRYKKINKEAFNLSNFKNQKKEG